MAEGEWCAHNEPVTARQAATSNAPQILDFKAVLLSNV